MARLPQVIEVERDWAPPHGLVYQFRVQDSQREYLSDGLTPTRLVSWLKAGDAGEVGELLVLFGELEDKDPRLASVLNTRRLALTGLPWDVCSAASQIEDPALQALADDVAAWTREQLSGVRGLEEGFEHLAQAIGPGVSVWENEWLPGRDGRPKLVAVVGVPRERLTTRYERGPQLRVLTRAEPTYGVETDLPGKFVVHAPTARDGFWFRGNLARSLSLTYLIKSYALKDWATFVERYGMPFLLGSYDASVTGPEKDAALAMMQKSLAHAVALFSKSLSIEPIEIGDRSSSPHKDLVEWCEKVQTIAVLGASLAVDTTGSTGTYAAASVHEGVRGDLLRFDAKKECATLRRHFIGPMVRFGYERPCPAQCYPKLERRLPETRDRIQEAEVIERATQRIGLALEEDVVYERLGLPKPKIDPATGRPLGKLVERIPPPPSPFAAPVNANPLDAEAQRAQDEIDE